MATIILASDVLKSNSFSCEFGFQLTCKVGGYGIST